jgi:hypothetical protein
MRKSASEMIRSLEMRVARLERQAYTSFIQEALDIMFLDMGGHRDRAYSSSEATEAIEVHLEQLAEEKTAELEERINELKEKYPRGRTLRSDRDYDNFAKDVYGRPDSLAKAVDQYLRGKGSLGNLLRKRKVHTSRLEK